MASRFYSHREVQVTSYDVTVDRGTRAEGLPRRYRAHLSNVQRLEGGRLMYVEVNLPDT